MKRLLGLLLVMGIVGCGKQNGPPPGITNTRPGIAKPLPAKPNKPQAKIDEPPVQAVDISKTVERGGLRYEINSETPFTGVSVEKYENGQKREQATFKDGKLEGPYIFWHANGQKKGEGTFKDGKREGLETLWHANGQKKSEATFKDGKEVSKTMWDEEGNEINK